MTTTTTKIKPKKVDFSAPENPQGMQTNKK
jgi:hypothetical protein